MPVIDTNLATNPSFETAGAEAAIRTNLVPDANMATGNSVSVYSGATVGVVTVPNTGYGTTAVRVSRTTAGTSLMAMVYPVPINPSSTVSGRILLRRKPGSAANLSLFVSPAPYVGGSGSGWATAGTGIQLLTLTDNWQEANFAGFVANAQTDTMGIQLIANGTWAATDGVEIYVALVEHASTPGTFFHGGTVTTNLTLNPRATSAGGGWSVNNGVVHDVAYVTSIPTHPLGITTAARSSVKSGVSNPSALSMYNIDGWANAGVERTHGLWVYSVASGYQVDTYGAWNAQPIPAGQWTFVRTARSTGQGAYSSFSVSKASGASADPADFIYVTGLVAEAGTKPVSHFYDATLQDFSYGWAAAVNASSSRQYAFRVAGIEGSAAFWQSFGENGASMSLRGAGLVYSNPHHTVALGSFYAARAQVTNRSSEPYSISLAIHEGVNYIAHSNTVIIPPDSTVEVNAPSTMGATATALRFYLYVEDSSRAITVENVIMKQVSGVGQTAGAYFDGSSKATPSRVYAWSGAANASTSTASTYSYLPVDFSDALSVNRRYLWFGTTRKMDWLPMPTSGMGVANNANTESGTYENGGGWGFRSPGSHKQYGFEFGVREASGSHGLDKYNQYATGYYSSYAQVSGARGTDYMLFADPATFDTNVLPPHWATPALALHGNSWHHIGPFTSRANTPANVYDQPPVTVTYNVDAFTHTSSMVNPRRRVIIPIPPTHQFVFGWSGTRTGAAGIGYSLYNHNGTITDVTTPIAPINNGTAAPRIGSLTVSGQTAYAVEIYLKGTASSQTVSITSMMAELVPLWESANVNGHNAGKHIAGQGHTGCMFEDDAIVETYEMIDTSNGRSVHYKGLSTTLKEIGAWGALA